MPSSKTDNPFMSIMKREKGRLISTIDPNISFWTHVEKTKDCWLWKGATQSMGYGMFWTQRKRILAHRFSLISTGIKLHKKDIVSHKCDTPLCVRPDHLFVGSQADNLHDMFTKGRGDLSGLELGRGKKGEESPLHKLTTSQVEAIKNSSERVGMLAKKYHIAHSSISRIKHGQAWKHVK